MPEKAIFEITFLSITLAFAFLQYKKNERLDDPGEFLWWTWGSSIVLWTPTSGRSAWKGKTKCNPSREFRLQITDVLIRFFM